MPELKKICTKLASCPISRRTDKVWHFLDLCLMYPISPSSQHNNPPLLLRAASWQYSQRFASSLPQSPRQSQLICPQFPRPEKVCVAANPELHLPCLITQLLPNKTDKDQVFPDFSSVGTLTEVSVFHCHQFSQNCTKLILEISSALSNLAEMNQLIQK